MDKAYAKTPTQAKKLGWGTRRGIETILLAKPIRFAAAQEKKMEVAV